MSKNEIKKTFTFDTLGHKKTFLKSYFINVRLAIREQSFNSNPPKYEFYNALKTFKGGGGG